MGDRQDFRPDDTGELKERWRSYIQDRRLNVTAQREAIVELFLRTRDHVSIDELLAKVRKRQPRVGYATVYRTLKLLVDSGLAVERQFGDGQARYEVVGHHHDHLICMKCGLILEFEDPEIERLQEKIARSLGGFSVLRHRHELYGLCPKAAGVEGGACAKEQGAATSPAGRDPRGGRAAPAGPPNRADAHDDPDAIPDHERGADRATEASAAPAAAEPSVPGGRSVTGP